MKFTQIYSVMSRCCAIFACLVMPLTVRAQDDTEFFEKRIRPVLIQHCYECHGNVEDVGGGLRLDSREGWMTGGSSGPAIVPQQPSESLLLRAISYEDPDLQMPPDAPLPAAIVNDFRQWIERGAVDPRSAAAPPIPEPPFDIDEGRLHWAYQLPSKPLPPVMPNDAWSYDAIDRFVFSRLLKSGLQPSDDADRETIVRRLYFDLTGLPPTVEQIDEFVHDSRPDAYERLVDRLLASPHFGERFGRHWLDIARYGESTTLRGLVFQNAWRYRDYVIDSLNTDRPIDQIIREHIAGDLLPADSLDERQRQHIATTFLAMGNWNLEEQDKAQLRMNVVDEQLEAIGRAFLAQTIGCARCHNHKFDPIPTSDYYALAGILRNTKSLENANVSKWLELPLPLAPDEEARLQAHEAAIAELEAIVQEKRKAAENDAAAADELTQLEGKLKDLRSNGPKRPMYMGVVEQSQFEDARIHIRGTVHQLGAIVPRGFLQVASYDATPSISPNESGRRELAEWLTSKQNPLTARVMVNRTWHWLVGSGLVRTTDNFGTTGEEPTHPELLDYLTVRFVEHGWSQKQLVRDIVLSHTYRLSTQSSKTADTLDPANRLLSHAYRRRLEAECLRDAMLAVSGQLNLQMGGPTIAPGTTEDYSYEHEEGRRSIYLPVLRNSLPEIFEVFNFADPSVVTGQRNSTTVAPQALYMLNHQFVYEQSRFAAQRLLALPIDDDRQLVERAFRMTLGRRPSAKEADVVLHYVESAAADEEEDTWTDIVQALFSSLDFRYLH